MINYIYQANNLLDKGCDALSEHVILPGIKATYQTAADLSIAVAGVFSQRLQQITDNLFHDPVSARKILFVTKRAELLTANLAVRKPLQFYPIAEYLSRSIISMNQHLHSYTKRINDLLRVPANLKSFLRRFSFETILNQMETTTPTYLIWMNRLIVQVKRFTLAVLDLIVRILDLFFRTCFLGIKFGLFSYLKEIILDARQNVYGHLADTAIKSIEKRETKLRRLIVSNVAESVTDYLGTCLTSVVVKSALGLLFYIPTKDLLRDHLGAPEWAIHTLGLTILTRILWSAVVKPTCDPYYEAYNPKYQSEGVSFLKFSEYFGIQAVYPITALAGNFFGVSSDKGLREL